MSAVNALTRNSPLLRVEQRKTAQLGARDACQFDSGRDAPSGCKFFILDASELAQELGLPTCSEVKRFVALDLEGMRSTEAPEQPYLTSGALMCKTVGSHAHSLTNVMLAEYLA